MRGGGPATRPKSASRWPACADARSITPCLNSIQLQSPSLQPGDRGRGERQTRRSCVSDLRASCTPTLVKAVGEQRTKTEDLSQLRDNERAFLSRPPSFLLCGDPKTIAAGRPRLSPTSPACCSLAPSLLQLALRAIRPSLASEACSRRPLHSVHLSLGSCSLRLARRATLARLPTPRARSEFTQNAGSIADDQMGLAQGERWIFTRELPSRANFRMSLTDYVPPCGGLALLSSRSRSVGQASLSFPLSHLGHGRWTFVN